MTKDRSDIKSPKPMPDPSKADPVHRLGQEPADAVARAEESLRDRPLRILETLRPRKRSR